MVHTKLFGRPERASTTSLDDINKIIDDKLKNYIRKNSDIDMRETFSLNGVRNPTSDKMASNKFYVDKRIDELSKDFEEKRETKNEETHVLRPNPLNLRDSKTDSTVKIKKIYGTFYKIFGRVKVLQKTGDNYKLCTIPTSYNGTTLEETDREICISDHKNDICLRFKVENNQYTLYIEESLDPNSEFPFEFYTLL